MDRIRSLWQASPRRVLLALGALLIVAAVAVGSGANFNSTSANPSNIFTAGTISSSNSKANAAILTANNLVPGDRAKGTVDIKNTGSAKGTFTLSHTAPIDTPTTPGLSRKLTLRIIDEGDPNCGTQTAPNSTATTTGTGTQTGTTANQTLSQANQQSLAQSNQLSSGLRIAGCPQPVTLYTGTIAKQPKTIPLGVYAPGATHRYVYIVYFPSSGPDGADNAYQGASTTVDYSWFSTS